MQNAKTTGDELKAYYSARMAIEEEYAKKLLALGKKPLGSAEQGTLKMSLDVVRAETEGMGKQHQMISQQMKRELDEPLAAFAGGLKERRKIVQTGIEKLLKQKNSQTIAVNKTRDKFEQDCLKIKGYLAQGHMVMGQEERKNKAKLEKTQVQMSSNSQEYEAAVKILEETTGRWNREWKAACDKFQDLEEERIDFFKSSLWSYANIASTVCVSDDQSCEKVRLSLEDCDVEKDITSFIKECGTGQEIPDPPKYINFCRGDVDDAASLQESDNGDYSVAQFARTMNPTFRSSSPQPSTFESHHDPDSSLRDEMGIPQARASVQGDDMFNPRGSAGSGAPPPLNPSYDGFNPRGSTGSGVVPPLNPSTYEQFNPRGSASSGAPPPLNPTPPGVQQDPYIDAPRVPHNPYPTDGMTQFCRMGPPSERSSIPSPVRPGSSGSQEHSDYTNPTSLDEPSSGQQSPTKMYNGSALSGMSSASEEPPAQKKKGFFNSPFRRKSNKSKENPVAARPGPPASRNTWAPNAPVARDMQPAASQSAKTSPTKPAFGAHNRSNTWQAKQPSPSPEPEGTDPRSEAYQLGIGNNVFDVASPDKKRSPAKKAVDPSMDPIAQALAELKGVTKQASVRQSADRHYGMSTPAPDARGVPAPFANNGVRNTPPPAYDQPPVSRLGAPQPAHTSREMRKTTEQFVAQKRDMFNTASRPGSRAAPGSRGGAPPMGQEPPRAASPAPLRSASPRPFAPANQDPRAQQQYRSASPNPYQQARPPSSAGRPRATSPNPYQSQGAPRPRAQSTSPIKSQQPSYNNYNSTPGGYQQPPRAASPNPAYAQRAPSSRGSDTGGAMALQLAPAPEQQQQRRPQSSYYGGSGDPYGTQAVATRNRSQSQAGQRQYTKEGRPILHYCKSEPLLWTSRTMLTL